MPTPFNFDPTASDAVKARIAACWALYFFTQVVAAKTGNKENDEIGKMMVILLAAGHSDLYKASLAELGPDPLKSFTPTEFLRLLESILVPAKEKANG